MRDISLALIGFGNVAQGLVQILAECGEQYAHTHGLRFLITAITDRSRGSIFHPQGIEPALLLNAAQNGQSLDTIDAPGARRPGWDALEMIAHAPADVLVEMSYTDLRTAQPAADYIGEALRRKMHVITTNKGPMALFYDSLHELARLNHVQIGIEGTVMSGTPVLRVGRDLIAPAGIRQVLGILNGTSNYILTQMEAGQNYAQALQDAQALGYAEADPTSDVEGLDAAAKVAILARNVLGLPITYAEVERQGIAGLRSEQITEAAQAGERWKLIAALEQTGSGWQASVRPRRLPLDHPLARIDGAGNALLYSTNLLGDVFLRGPGAGRVETGYAIIQDLFAICQDSPTLNA